VLEIGQRKIQGVDGALRAAFLQGTEFSHTIYGQLGVACDVEAGREAAPPAIIHQPHQGGLIVNGLWHNAVELFEFAAELVVQVTRGGDQHRTSDLDKLGLKLESQPEQGQRAGRQRFTQAGGGSGGARTCHKTNKIKGSEGLPSQIASQISGVSADLQRVIDSWGRLSEPLRRAVLAIIGSADRRGQ
jgi:hypothetical protein